ncbi:hypothetical protein NGC65_13765, partial [Staphylococcus xylosus]|uniref:hypothetical protein n=1 Tax=Staphylococcus xylosus TaxID=1288 RepID=UPI002DBC2284
LCCHESKKNSNVVSKRANNGLKDHCFLKNNYINKNKQTLRINELTPNSGKEIKTLSLNSFKMNHTEVFFL